MAGATSRQPTSGRTQLHPHGPTQSRDRQGHASSPGCPRRCWPHARLRRGLSGYGDSLIDYNWYQNTIGVGISLNDYLDVRGDGGEADRRATARRRAARRCMRAAGFFGSAPPSRALAFDWADLAWDCSRPRWRPGPACSSSRPDRRASVTARSCASPPASCGSPWLPAWTSARRVFDPACDQSGLSRLSGAPSRRVRDGRIWGLTSLMPARSRSYRHGWVHSSTTAWTSVSRSRPASRGRGVDGASPGRGDGPVTEFLLAGRLRAPPPSPWGWCGILQGQVTRIACSRPSCSAPRRCGPAAARVPPPRLRSPISPWMLTLLAAFASVASSPAGPSTPPPPVPTGPPGDPIAPGRPGGAPNDARAGPLHRRRGEPGCAVLPRRTLGLLRFPDTLTACTPDKADNLGLGLVVLGLLPQVASPLGVSV